MPCIVGVQLVGICILVILPLVRLQRIHSGKGVHVNHRICPNIASFLHAFHITVEILVTFVLVSFCGLDVLFVEIRKSSVYRCEQHYLLGREHFLYCIQSYIYPAAIGGCAHYRFAHPAFYNSLRLVCGCKYGSVYLAIPFAYRYSCIVIIGAYEYYYCVEVITVVFFKLFCLAWNVVPLLATYCVYIGRNAQPVLQKSPVFFFRSVVLGVCNRVAKISYAFSFPRMLCQS